MSVLVLKEDGGNLARSFDKILNKFDFVHKKRVFIKPNFSGRPPIIPGENTDPVFLEELIKVLINKGTQEIYVGHGALLGTLDRQFPFEKIIDEGGFSFLRNIPQVKVLNLDNEEKEIIEYGGIKFSIPKILKTFCAHINLVKIKTHMETTVTLSLKNQMGLVSMGDRINMHRTALEKSIAYLGKLIKPTLNIVDGIISMEGNGPHHGQAQKTNIIVSGDDMVEIDSVICYLLGINFRKVKHISIAENIGVGNYPQNNFLSSVEKYKILDFKLASKFEKFGKNIYVWPTMACSRCITAVNECGKIVKKNPFKNLNLISKIYLGNRKINLVIGKTNENDLKLSKDEKIICIGQCAKDFAEKRNLDCLNKCPPSVQETLEYIKNQSSKND